MDFQTISFIERFFPSFFCFALLDSGLTEEEVVIANAASESPEAEKAVQRAAIVVRLRDGMSSLGRILKAIETYHCPFRITSIPGRWCPI